MRLFERLSSYCLFVMPGSAAASKANGNRDDDGESRKDTHLSVPSFRFLVYDYRGFRIARL